MHRHLLSHCVVATAVAVVMVLAPGFRPSALAVAAVCCGAAAVLALRYRPLHRQGHTRAEPGDRPPSGLVGSA